MNNKGFTLIELLVVISIIGVISSVVFVSFSGSREKAKLAKAQQFDAQVSHALGAYAVGIWRFEEGSGTTLHDESGYGNDGTFHGNPTPVFPDGVYSGTTALQFDGVNDYVNCGNGSSLNITDAITIEMWVEFNDISETKSILGKWEGGTGGYSIAHVTNDLLISVHDVNNYKYAYNILEEDKWIHITVIFDNSVSGTTNFKTYINGVSKIDSSRPIDIGSTTNSLKIGCCAHYANNFNGSIDNVAIYDEALSSAQIQQHFAASAASHNIALK